MALAWALGMWITGAAQGATYNLGLLTAESLSRVVEVSPPRSINDRFDFVVGGEGAGHTGHYRVEFSMVPGLNFSVSNLSVQLFRAGGEAVSDAFAFRDVLAGGSYYTAVTGHASGAVVGTYRFTISASPAVVPLPPAAWLLAAGLAGLVGIARRKNSPAGGRAAAE
jgi:hypothetical protein